MNKSQGQWNKSEQTTEYLDIRETTKVYTFNAKSGFKAVMTKRPGQGQPYLCKFINLQGMEASYVSDAGLRTTGMVIHLTLNQAKHTVQETMPRVEAHHAQPDPSKPS